MSKGPEAQDSLFHDVSHTENIPPTLARAQARLQFPPSYVVVGVYRLCTDKLLYVPVWNNCKQGTQRGLVVGAIWASLTFGIQKKIVQIFLARSHRIVGLSEDTFLGYKLPFSVHTYTTILLVGAQITAILKFFLSFNTRIVRQHVWAHTVASRGKGPDFWQPYVEEWEHPPVVDLTRRGILTRWFRGWVWTLVIKRAILFSVHLYPLVGIFASAWLRAMDTGRYLHKQYFETKKMTKEQIAIFTEERKWDYRAFGFIAALLEGLPVIGLVFSISNRIGAAMWAHDLEKRQHFIASQQQARVHEASPSNKQD